MKTTDNTSTNHPKLEDDFVVCNAAGDDEDKPLTLSDMLRESPTTEESAKQRLHKELKDVEKVAEAVELGYAGIVCTTQTFENFAAYVTPLFDSLIQKLVNSPDAVKQAFAAVVDLGRETIVNCSNEARDEEVKAEHAVQVAANVDAAARILDKLITGNDAPATGTPALRA
jgi:hypothetical protein